MFEDLGIYADAERIEMFQKVVDEANQSLANATEGKYTYRVCGAFAWTSTFGRDHLTRNSILDLMITNPGERIKCDCTERDFEYLTETVVSELVKSNGFMVVHQGEYCFNQRVWIFNGASNGDPIKLQFRMHKYAMISLDDYMFSWTLVRCRAFSVVLTEWAFNRRVITTDPSEGGFPFHAIVALAVGVYNFDEGNPYNFNYVFDLLTRLKNVRYSSIDFSSYVFSARPTEHDHHFVHVSFPPGLHHEGNVAECVTLDYWEAVIGPEILRAKEILKRFPKRIRGGSLAKVLSALLKPT